MIKPKEFKMKEIVYTNKEQLPDLRVSIMQTSNTVSSSIGISKQVDKDMIKWRSVLTLTSFEAQKLIELLNECLNRGIEL